MQLLRLMESQLRVEVKRRLALERNRATTKEPRDPRRTMNAPLAAPRRAFDRSPPLPKPRFFPDVDLLPAPDETDDDAPLRDSVREANELLGLGEHVVALVRLARLIDVERALRLVEDEHVLRRHRVATRVPLHVILHPAHECLSISDGAHLSLQDLDERAVATEEHGRCRRLSAAAVDGEVVEVLRVHGLKTNERLSRARHAGQQDHVS